MDRYFRANDKINGYRIIKIIGIGRYGIVYLGINNSGEKYVIKQLKRDMLKQTQDKLFYEEEILESLDYPIFPKFISKFNDGYREGYILQYMEGKVFQDLLAEDGYEFRKKEIYIIADKLLDIVDILHNKNIVHRDIRLPNVILQKNNRLALIDFGLARFIDNKKYDKDIDYWYIGDFLIHLYYSSFKEISNEEKPWYKELNLNREEKFFLKRLMRIESRFRNSDEIRTELEKLKSIIWYLISYGG